MSFYALKAAATRARSLAWARRARREDEPGLRILFYHRISHDPDELAVGRRAFRQHMDYLATESYRVVDVLEAVDLLDSGEPVPRAIGLSFDDGYLDVAEEALPLLSERGLPRDRLCPARRGRRLGEIHLVRDPAAALGWEEIVELDRECTLGFEAHSLTHPNLLALRDAPAREEIVGSKTALEARRPGLPEAPSRPRSATGTAPW